MQKHLPAVDQMKPPNHDCCAIGRRFIPIPGSGSSKRAAEMGWMVANHLPDGCWDRGSYHLPATLTLFQISVSIPNH
jgi:hypothetical protein